MRSPLHNYYSAANGGIGGVLVCTAPRFSKRTEYIGKERAQINKHGARNYVHTQMRNMHVLDVVDARSNGACCKHGTVGLLLRR